MKLSKYAIDIILIPLFCIIPVFGVLSCSADQAADVSSQAFDTVSQRLSEFPKNAQTAAPMIQEDLENLWFNVTGTIEVVGEQVGISEPPHPLAEAKQVREKLISGASFAEVANAAMHQLTGEDLENMPTSDLSALNGVLPFDIDLESCGENLAEVLNTLDIGQVSAVLKSDAGYHLIQLIDRDGARVKIGHIVFEIDPADNTAVVEEPAESKYDLVAQGAGSEDESDPLLEAIERLSNAVNNHK